MSHNIFAPSKSPMWLRCAGSMSFPENRVTDKDAGQYAAEGTAAHILAARALTAPNLRRAADYVGETIQVGERTFNIDEDFALYVDVYLDYVRDRAKDGYLLVEQHVEIPELGTDGTSDAIIARETGLCDVVDLKFGRGEKVYASESFDNQPSDEFSFSVGRTGQPPYWVVPNYQLMLYGLGSIDLLRPLGDIDSITLAIVQPRLDSISEVLVPIHALHEFAEWALDRRLLCDKSPPQLTPGQKQCRWCEVKATCPALAAKVEHDIGAEFEAMSAEVIPAPETAINAALALKLSVLPLIEDWCSAVRSTIRDRVMAGQQIIGVDGKPLKIVEGKQGDRKWIDEKTAEGRLAGLLADKAYQPLKVITPAAAAKLLDKAKTAAMWQTIVPLYKRAPGKPIVVPNSDPRESFIGATAAEFDDAV
jgi:hypothetical protein